MRETDAPPSREERREPSLFASSSEEPRHRSGVGIWFAAAAALVFGIALGFASGYRAARVAPSPSGAFESPAPTSGAGQTFSESSVSEPTADAKPSAPAREEPTGPSRRLVPATGPIPKKPSENSPAATPAPPPQAAKTREKVGRVSPPRAETTGAATTQEPAPTGPASLQVLSRPPGAQVVMDGRPVGRTPMTIADVPVGMHSIRLELSGFKRWETTEDVKAGSATRVAASLEQ